MSWQSGWINSFRMYDVNSEDEFCLGRPQKTYLETREKRNEMFLSHVMHNLVRVHRRFPLHSEGKGGREWETAGRIASHSSNIHGGTKIFMIYPCVDLHSLGLSPWPNPSVGHDIVIKRSVGLPFERQISCHFIFNWGLGKVGLGLKNRCSLMMGVSTQHQQNFKLCWNSV